MKILLIEDELKTAQSIKAWLEDCQMEVDCAYDAQTGRILAERHEYDVIVSDIVMPKGNGVDLCRHFRGLGIKTPMLLLSALSQPEDKVAGLNAGADDYLAKPFDFTELQARIHALYRRIRAGITPQTNKLNILDLELNLDTQEAHRGGQYIPLTPREFSLIEYFIRNSGRVISKSEILEKVWGLDVEINTNVIEVYVNYLRKKIDKGFERKLIHTQFGVGYILKT
jgi:two-component system, OmpR family, copper resistance phosphate regulon response regulator CusR